MIDLLPVHAHGALLLAVPLLPLLVVLGLAQPALRRISLGLAAWAALPAVLAAMLLPDGAEVRVSALVNGARFGIDETGRTFLMFTGLLWWLAGHFGAHYLVDDRRRERFTAFYLLAMAGSLGINICLDPISFFMLFAVMSLASFGLVAHNGDEAARRAAKIYIALTLLGETFLFIAVILIVSGGHPTLPYRDPEASNMIIALVLVSFGIKAGALPLHFWLPLAHPAAPMPASAVLSGAMIKAGLLGWIRFLPLGAVSEPNWGLFCVIAGLAAAFYGAIAGVTKASPKVVLAYSSISQMGLITVPIGIALAFPAVAPLSIVAALIYALHHGLAKGVLFLGVGMGHYTARLRSLVFAGLLVPASALAGLPLTSGAVAKSALKSAAGLTDWYGWLVPLLSLTAIGTTLLMARFLVNLYTDTKEECREKPRLWTSWAGLQLASFLLIWLWPLAQDASAATLSIDKALGALWPALVGTILGLIFWQFFWRRTASAKDRPERDILRKLEIGIWHSGASVAATLGKVEQRLRDWPFAGVVFLVTLILFFAMLSL